MAQGGNYYANLAHSLSTQDTASVANSIANALSNSSDAIDKAYQAGKNANDAFGSLLDTNGTSLGKVLDHFATKEANENIEANKQDALLQAEQENKIKEANLLAEYNAKQNAYINDKTQQVVGRDYDGMKNDLDKVIREKTDGRLDYEKYMFYMNRPDLITQAQQFRNFYDNANKTIDEKGNLLTSPMDLKILSDLEELEKDRNMSYWTTRMRDIEVEKDRIKRGVITEEEYHTIYKQSRDNAYKVTKNYNEVTFRETMNIEDRNTRFKTWASNFNANVPPALWKENVPEASRRTDENAKNSSISANKILAEKPVNISVEVPTDIDETGVANGYDRKALTKIDEQARALEEEFNSKEYRERSELVNSSVNQYATSAINAIGAVSNTGNLDAMTMSNGSNTGVINTFGDALQTFTRDYVPGGNVALDFFGYGELASLGLTNYEAFKEFMSEGNETKETKQTKEKIDKEAGVNDKDTPKQKNEKRRKWYENVRDKTKGLGGRAGSGILGLGKTAIKTFGKFLGIPAEGIQAIGGAEESIRISMGNINAGAAVYQPKDEHEAKLYDRVFKGNDPSQVMIDLVYQMENFNINNPATYLKWTTDELDEMLVLINRKEEEGYKAVTLGGKLQGLALDKEGNANEQLKVMRLIVTNAREVVSYQNESIPTKQKELLKEREIILKTPTNLKSNISYKEAAEEEAEAKNTEGEGENLLKLTQNKLLKAKDASELAVTNLASMYSNGMENNPKNIREEQTTFALTAIANLNDQTKQSLYNRNVKTPNMDRATAVVQFSGRGLIFDKTNGDQNKVLLEKVSQSPKVVEASKKLENVLLSDDYEGWVTKNGKVVGAYNDLVSSISEELKGSNFKFTDDFSSMTPKQQKEYKKQEDEFNSFVKENENYVPNIGQRFITNKGMASRLAYNIAKFYSFQASVEDPSYLDFSNPDNQRRLNNSRFNHHISMYDPGSTKKQINKEAGKIPISPQKTYENIIEKYNPGVGKPVGRNTENNVIYRGDFVTVERGTDDKGKSANRISIKGSPKEINKELDKLLAQGVISKKEYDNLYVKMSTNSIDTIKKKKDLEELLKGGDISKEQYDKLLNTLTRK